MSLQRILDNRMLALQRQGRIGFYGPSLGQEAAIVGAAMAMEPEDWIVPQYREPGAALVRGMPLKELLCQLIGNAEDPVHGRQMPCHYVYRKGNYLSISSPVGTQIPHAVGIAWAMRLRGEPHAVLVFFGDGATSTADFHAAMNFAGVFRTPTVFLCNNNQWAISVPVARQTASATLAPRGRGAHAEERPRRSRVRTVVGLGAPASARAVQAGPCQGGPRPRPAAPAAEGRGGRRRVRPRGRVLGCRRRLRRGGAGRPPAMRRGPRQPAGLEQPRVRPVPRGRSRRGTRGV